MFRHDQPVPVKYRIDNQPVIKTVWYWGVDKEDSTSIVASGEQAVAFARAAATAKNRIVLGLDDELAVVFSAKGSTSSINKVLKDCGFN